MFQLGGGRQRGLRGWRGRGRESAVCPPAGATGICRTGDALGPVALRAIGPDVHFTHRADDAGRDPVVDAAGSFAGMSLVAHLRGDLRFRRHTGQEPRLVHGIRERLLDVDVLAELHRGDRHRGVQVVGGGDDDRVDVALLVEHLAEVGVLGGLRVGVPELDGRWRDHAFAVGSEAAGQLAFAVGGIDVADGGEVLAGIDEFGDVAHAHAAKADAGEVECVGWGPAEGRGAEDMSGDDHGTERELGAVGHEVPAGEVTGHGRVAGWGGGGAVRSGGTVQRWRAERRPASPIDLGRERTIRQRCRGSTSSRGGRRIAWNSPATSAPFRDGVALSAGSDRS